MKTLFILCLCVLVFQIQAQIFNNANDVGYYERQSEYVILEPNNILLVTPGSSLSSTFYAGGSSLVVIGDSAFTCNGSQYLNVINIRNGGTSYYTGPTGSNFTQITYDLSGNIFMTDYAGHKVEKFSLATHQFSTLGTLNTQHPEGITYDTLNHRLILTTDAPDIVAEKITSGQFTTLHNTSLNDLKDIAMDDDGNFFVSNAGFGVEAVYFYDSSFAGPPIRIDSLGNNNSPAGIFYNKITDTLAVAIPNSGEIKYYGFPHPKPVNDWAALVVSDSQTICVLQNDKVTGPVPMYMKAISTPALGTAYILNNCIHYTADSGGIDTIAYTVCTIDTPSFCRTGYVFIINDTGTGNHAPIANNFSETTFSGIPVSINISSEDADPDGDSICVVALIGSSYFTVDSTNCNNIIFTPDTPFIGMDSCIYIICDNDTVPLCDTAMIYATVQFNESLLPIADFTIDYNNLTCFQLTTVNTSTGDTGMPVWHFMEQYFNTPVTLYGDTGYYINFNMWGFYGQVCIYVSNQYGSDSLCHTYNFICESAPTIEGKEVQLYPNPAQKVLNIDFGDQLNETVGSFVLEIADITGRKLKQLNYNQPGQFISIQVGDLTPGVYLLNMVTDNGKKRKIGRFIVGG